MKVGWKILLPMGIGLLIRRDCGHAIGNLEGDFGGLPPTHDPVCDSILLYLLAGIMISAAFW